MRVLVLFAVIVGALFVSALTHGEGVLAGSLLFCVAIGVLLVLRAGGRRA